MGRKMDVTRFVRGAVGIPAQELMVIEQRKQLELMKKSLPVQKYPAEVQREIEIIQPQVHVDMRGIAEEMAPQFDELIETQQELARYVRGLGYIGQLALEKSEAQTTVLKSLDKQGEKAFQQRNKALHHLSSTVDKLGSIDAGIGRANKSLVSIDRGVASIDEGVAKVSDNIIHLENSLCGTLGDIGMAIADIGRELIKTRMEVIDALHETQDIFLWSHREQMWARKQILEVLKDPIWWDEAYRAWKRGETCRLAEDLDGAMKMYKKSLDMNPAESRNYFSLGLVHLNFGDTQDALNYFYTASQYSINDPKMQSYSLMHIAKVEMYEGNDDKAKSLLEKALNLDITNLEVWYDLAVCSIKLGDATKALYYIKSLLDKRVNPRYALKVVGEVEFSSIMPQIREILTQSK